MATPGRVRAQGIPEAPAAAPAGSEREAEALAAFRQGVSAAQVGDWAAAHASFERAHELSPRPVVLFNLAAAQVQIGRLLAGEDSYRRFLESPGDSATPATAERRAAAERVLRDLERRIPRVRLAPTGLEPTDTLELDGQPVDWPTQRDVRVDRGTHTLRILRDGALLGAVDFEVAEFEARTLTWTAPVVLQPRQLQPPPTAPALSGRPASDAPRSWWRSTWPWTALAASLAAVGVAAFVLTRPSRELFVGNVGRGYVEVP